VNPARTRLPRLARAYKHHRAAVGAKVLSGGVDSKRACKRPKTLLSALPATSKEGVGSLNHHLEPRWFDTPASAPWTKSPSFEGIQRQPANLEIHLDRKLDRPAGCFPSIDIQKSGYPQGGAPASQGKILNRVVGPAAKVLTGRCRPVEAMELLAVEDGPRTKTNQGLPWPR